MYRFIAIAAAFASLTSTPAAAQYGRLVDTGDLMRLSQNTCIQAGTDFQRTVPSIALRQHWDEYGKKPGTPETARAWLVSIRGLPAVVDINRNGAVGSCSVSAVSDPNAIVRSFTAARGKPRSTRKPNGDLVNVWPASSGKPVLSVTNAPGQAMTRITITATR